MNECMEREIRELLPDVLHGTITPGERARVEAHLASCAQCRDELGVLRAVRGAAVFAPSIDVNRVTRQIPPYGIITPVVDRPKPSRTAAWLVAAAVAFVIAGGGSVLMRPGGEGTGGDAADSTRAAQVGTARGLALASGVDGLSDGGLVQLIGEVNGFDALPASEPEPIFAVDTTDAIEQDSL